MDFEWDEEKRARNINKHGIDFVSVIPVFDDPHAIETYDSEHSGDEGRYQIIGMARPGVLFVAYTERDNGNTIRFGSKSPPTSHSRSL